MFLKSSQFFNFKMILQNKKITQNFLTFLKTFYFGMKFQNKKFLKISNFFLFWKEIPK